MPATSSHRPSSNMLSGCISGLIAACVMSRTFWRSAGSMSAMRRSAVGSLGLEPHIHRQPLELSRCHSTSGASNGRHNVTTRATVALAKRRRGTGHRVHHFWGQCGTVGPNMRGSELKSLSKNQRFRVLNNHNELRRGRRRISGGWRWSWTSPLLSPVVGKVGANSRSDC